MIAVAAFLALNALFYVLVVNRYTSACALCKKEQCADCE